MLKTIRDRPSGQLARWFCPERLPCSEEQPDSPQRRMYNRTASIKEKFEPPAPPPDVILTPVDQDTSRQHHPFPEHDAKATAVTNRQQEDSTTPRIHGDGHIICDRDSVSDPENPLNWSRGRKLWVVANICSCSFVVYMSAPIWTPGEESFMESIGTSYEYTSLGLALFVFGYGVGPLLFAPLSEIASVGRNFPYVATFIVYMIVTVPTALVRNAQAFMFLRFLQGFFGSPILATGGASLSDVYGPTYLPCAMTGWAFACFVAPVIGQVIAGAAIPYLGWRFSIWESLMACAPVIVTFLFLPETSSATILQHRARRLRKILGTDCIRSVSEIEGHGLSVRAVAMDSLVKPLEISLLDPAVLFANIYLCLIYGIYYSFFEAFPIV